MIAAVNNLGNIFGNSKSISTFGEPNVLCRFGKSKDSIHITADKAGFLRLSCSKADSTFGDFKGGSPLCIVHIANFRSQMPNVTKNCKQTARGASTATANARNSVSTHPLSRVTKSELIALVEGNVTGFPIRDVRYSLMLAAFLEWVKCENKGLYAPYVRDNNLTKRLNAIREAFSVIKKSE